MSGYEEVRVDLTARHPMTDLTLVDSAFRVAAEGTGRLRTRLAAGLYELRANAGDGYSTRLVALRGAEAYVRTDVDAPFETVTPLAGSAKAEFIRMAWKRMRARDPRAVSVFVVLDDPRRHVVELVTPEGHLVPGAADVSGPADGSFEVRAQLLPAGGYLLRFTIGQAARALPLWLPEGYCTVVFIPSGEAGPDVRSAVVHLSPSGDPWRPERERDVLLESLLRRSDVHRPALPDRLVTEAERWSGAPMIAVAAAALAAGTGHREEQALLVEARRLLPDHPDVRALSAVAGAGKTAEWPPLLAAAYWRALLPADQRGAEVIRASSPLSDLAPGLSSLGPYLTAPSGPVDVADWAGRHLTPLLQEENHPVAAAVRSGDAKSVAELTGLPLAAARKALAAVADDTGEQSQSALRALQELFDRDPEATRLTVPESKEWEVPGPLVGIRWELDPEGRGARVFALGSELPSEFSLLLSRQTHARHLLRFENGEARWRASERGSFTVSVPLIERIGGLVAVEALSLEPAEGARFGSGEEPIRRMTALADGALRLSAFERVDHGLELVVRSDRGRDQDRYAVVSVRKPDEPDQQLVVPLVWLRTQGQATGALRVGLPRPGAAVFLVPEPLLAAELPIEAVERSIALGANSATTRALQELYDRLRSDSE
ncbi:MULTISPECIES: hypothetical protein [Amycolatopsis]|uniref:Uncharacterized protein n=1 Tax=Amycolatopsis albidoflavus TaxID=102226 RepID=A0ABW5I7U2_9PSEU